MDNIYQQRDDLVRQITKAIANATKTIQKNPDTARDEAEIKDPIESVQEEEKEELKAEEPEMKEVGSIPKIIKGHGLKKLIYFNYPIVSDKPPAWAGPLRKNLVSDGYLVYEPQLKLHDQFFENDLEDLKKLTNKLIPSMCSVFKFPEDIVLPFDNPVVNSTLANADNQLRAEQLIFKDLWFLIHSSLTIVDLMKLPVGGGFVQKLVYGKLLNIPSIGVSLGDIVDPWIQKYLSVVFTDEFNIVNFLPLVKGYAPL